MWGWQKREKDVESLVDEKGTVVVREVELVGEEGKGKQSGQGNGGEVDRKEEEERGRTKGRKGKDEEPVVGAGANVPFH